MKKKEMRKQEEKMIKILLFLLSVFLLALNYNLFLLPNNFVIGGTSGIAIILRKLYEINTAVFISIMNILLLIISFIFLGKKETSRSIIGSVLYPLFISLTVTFTSYLLPYLKFDNTLIVALLGGVLSGVANGLLYKSGFTTGGSDILMKIVNKYGKIPEGKAVFTINIFIMLFESFVFGANQFVYSLIVLYLSTKIIDKIMTGISTSKLFFIYTKEEEKIKKLIIEDLKMGVTVLTAQGGFSKESNHVFMCAVPNKTYYLFKEKVLEIDAQAFFVINDCYEVAGGVKGKKFPFI